MATIFEAYIQDEYNIDKILTYSNMVLDEISQYNDTLMPLDEAIDLKELGKKVWGKILDLFKKIGDIFSKFIRNIKLNASRFKETELPKEQVDDLEKCLKVSEGRMLDNVGTIVPQFITGYMFKKTDNQEINLARGGANTMGFELSLEFDMDKVIVDTKECIAALHKLPEYDRLTGDHEYESKDMKKINLNNISGTLIKSNKMVDVFTRGLTKISKIERSDDNDTVKKIINKFRTMCNSCITYFNERIKLLNIFFRSTKVAVTSILDKNKKADISSENKKAFKGYKIKKVSSEKISKVESLMNEMRDLNENRDFTKYKQLHAEACKILGINDRCAFAVVNGICQYLEASYKKIPVGGRPLYHSSSRDDLTELTPQAIINGGVLFRPDPSIYVNMNMILNRYHRKIGSDVQIFFGVSTIKNEFEKHAIYQIDENIDYVYADTEMKGAASIIITDKPIKVKKIDYDKWAKDNNIEEDKDKEEESEDNK